MALCKVPIQPARDLRREVAAARSVEELKAALVALLSESPAAVAGPTTGKGGGHAGAAA